MDPKVLQQFDALVNRCERFERKGKTVPYTSANGYMFAMLNKDAEFGIRFSKESQEKYAAEFGTEAYRSHGAVMRGYVHIPTKYMQQTERMIDLLNEAYDHVMSLPPK